MGRPWPASCRSHQGWSHGMGHSPGRGPLRTGLCGGSMRAHVRPTHSAQTPSPTYLLRPVAALRRGHSGRGRLGGRTGIVSGGGLLLALTSHPHPPCAVTGTRTQLTGMCVDVSWDTGRMLLGYRLDSWEVTWNVLGCGLSLELDVGWTWSGDLSWIWVGQLGSELR